MVLVVRKVIDAYGRYLTLKLMCANLLNWSKKTVEQAVDNYTLAAYLTVVHAS